MSFASKDEAAELSEEAVHAAADVYGRWSQNIPTGQAIPGFLLGPYLASVENALLFMPAALKAALKAAAGPADPYAEVKSRGYFVICCRACDEGTPLPIPFKTADERGAWAARHTRGTGHASWYVLDPS